MTTGTEALVELWTSVAEQRIKLGGVQSGNHTEQQYDGANQNTQQGSSPGFRQSVDLASWQWRSQPATIS
jgi:hypothetical protein